MLSVRESTFESNSSSCHSLTICRKSFMERLMREEIVYTGPFRAFSDMDETFVNELDETAFITVDEIWTRLKEWANKVLVDEDESSYHKEDARLILELNTFQEYKAKLEEEDSYWQDHIIPVIGDKFEVWERMFGAEHSDNYIEWSKEYDLADGDKLVIRQVDIAC